ncbi:MAG: hypothetical protein NTV44_06635 [Firmicutes bacterium]|nr:hypothetical protein [Bacillota bacterium]
MPNEEQDVILKNFIKATEQLNEVQALVRDHLKAVTDLNQLISQLEKMTIAINALHVDQVSEALLKTKETIDSFRSQSNEAAKSLEASVKNLASLDKRLTFIENSQAIPMQIIENPKKKPVKTGVAKRTRK